MLKPRVARLKDIAKDLRFGSFPIGVAFKSTAEIRSIVPKFADRFASFVGVAANAESLFVAYWARLFRHRTDQCRAGTDAPDRRDAADGSGFAFDVK